MDLKLDWQTIPAGEVAQHPHLLADLLDKKIDGVTVTGVFTPEESAAVCAAMARPDWREHFIGGIVGMALGMIWDDPEREAYLDDTEQARAKLVELFGFDPHERLQEVLGPGADGIPLLPATERGRPYNAGQLRHWDTGKPGLKAHVGNEFRRDLAEHGMKHLLTTTSVKDHLSYFIVLQPPDEGGELSVYDLKWDEDDASNDDRVDLRDDSRFDDMPALKLDPGPGDLILFGGGWRWHRVEPLTGTVPRVTYGGFCARSHDGREIHWWA